jgi:ABC-type metal ion transport system substrate-binding protein
MAKYIVELHPRITPLAMLAISAEVGSVMKSVEDSTEQYEIDICIVQLSQYNQGNVFYEDIKLLENLREERVDAIEF